MQTADETINTLRELQDAGATMISLRFVHHSVEHYVEQLEAMAELEAAW